MIERVHLKYFKQFKEQSFELADTVVLAGPNNAGKTTLLQAIATWSFAWKEWQSRQNTSKGRSGKPRGVPLTRKEFMSVPVQRFNLLWPDASTALGRAEGGGRGAATPRLMQITLEGGSNTQKPWKHTMEFRYTNSELIYAHPVEGSDIPDGETGVVYMPPFSGIEIEEKVHTLEYQEWLIGQGRPGDIIRNLIVEVSSREPAWNGLSKDIENMFGYRLLKPEHKGRPFIQCDYLPGIPSGRGRGGYPKLDIASAGSGFLQVLLLLSFLYARPSSILLIDEPDAHLHVVLQKKVYEYLKETASQRQCQLVIATHSEVVIDNTSPEQIVSFYGGQPHRLTQEKQRNRVREALKRINPMEALQATQKMVLYVEDHIDFDYLNIWANILNHPVSRWFSSPNLYYVPMKGSVIKVAKDHFFALQAIHSDMRGIVLLDGDNKEPLDNTGKELRIMQWQRYEVENYLVHPDPIRRFCENSPDAPLADEVMKNMTNILPPAVMQKPLDNNHDYLKVTPASKTILPRVLGEEFPKNRYTEIAREMRPEEIPHEVTEKLDSIAQQLDIDDDYE